MSELRTPETAGDSEQGLPAITTDEQRKDLKTFLDGIHKKGLWYGTPENVVDCAAKLGLDKIDPHLVSDICTTHALFFLYRLRNLLLKNEIDDNQENKESVTYHLGHHAHDAVWNLRDSMKKDAIADELWECRLCVYEFSGSCIYAAEQRTYATDQERAAALAQAEVAEQAFKQFEIGMCFCGEKDTRDRGPVFQHARKVVEMFNADPELQIDPDAIRMRIAERFPYKRFGLRSALEED